MQLVRLEVYQQHGQIAIQQELGRAEINYRHAEQQIRTDHLQVQIDVHKGGLNIDQSKAWAALGLMKTSELRQKIYTEVEQIALQAIAKYVQDANRLLAIHQPGDALVELAKQRAHANLIPIDYTGPARYDNVAIDYQPDRLSISFTGGTVHIQANPQQPTFQYMPGHTVISMKEYPSIRFEVKGNYVDRWM